MSNETNVNEDNFSSREELLIESIKNYISESCYNSKSLGHGVNLDRLAGEIELKLFIGILDACIANPNLDCEIFFDSFSDDLRLLFNKFGGEYIKIQQLKQSKIEAHNA